MRFEKKVAVVSGGNRGIGEAIVRQLASEGAQVLFLGKDLVRNEKVAQKINRQYPGSTQSYSVDVADEQAVNAWWSEVDKVFGRIDILVNNAGICHLTQPFWSLRMHPGRKLCLLICMESFICFGAVFLC